MTNPLVTVVIPALNRAHLLRPTIESVLGQTYPHIECIVVDAGSSDGTVELLQSYGHAVKWVSEPDGGHADAINKGWAMGSGQILAWLNADDLWDTPDAVAQAVAYLQANPGVVLVYGDCGVVDANGRITGPAHVRDWDLRYAVEYCDYIIPQPAAFIRRSILDQVGYLDVNFISKKDHELWLRIALGGTIAHIPVRLAFARTSPGHWDTRGDITGTACVELTEKFYGLPGIPLALAGLRARALSNSHLVGAMYCYWYGRHIRFAVLHTLRALLSDPTNTSAVLKTVGRGLLPFLRSADGRLAPR